MEWLIKDDTIRTYELIKTNLPLLLNRIRLFGKVPQKEKTPYLLSEMNEQGDVLKDWALNREQFNYIKKQLKLKVINI